MSRCAYIVAKCPGMTGTVPEYLHMSRLTQKAGFLADFELRGNTFSDIARNLRIGVLNYARRD